MDQFEKYLTELAIHEQEITTQILKDPREVILVNSGVRLNWIGDYLSNPNLKWTKKTIPIENIEFTGTSLDWNEILINQCSRSPQNFFKLIESNPNLKQKFQKESSYNPNFPILLRRSQRKSFYKVLDGMHRFVGSIVNGNKTIEVYIPDNEKILPYCEPHVLYDLIKGYVRNSGDSESEKELYYSLKLMIKSYANSRDLLENRFNIKYVADQKVQEIIQKALKNS